MRRLHLVWNTTHQLLRAYRDSGSEGHASSAAEIPAIEIDCPQPQDGWRQSQWESFISAWRFDTSRVETLTLKREPGEKRSMSFERQYPTLERLPELKTLCVVSLEASDLHRIIREVGGGPVSFQMPKVLCPCPKLPGCRYWGLEKWWTWSRVSCTRHSGCTSRSTRTTMRVNHGRSY